MSSANACKDKGGKYSLIKGCQREVNSVCLCDFSGEGQKVQCMTIQHQKALQADELHVEVLKYYVCQANKFA